MYAQKMSTPAKKLALLTCLLTGMSASSILGCGAGGGTPASTPDFGGLMCPMVQSDIFSDAGDVPQGDVIEQDPGRTVLRRRWVHVDSENLRQRLRIKGNRVRLNLFDDRDVQVLITDVQQIDPTNVIATGNIAGDETSDVTIVSKDDAVVARVHDHASDETFEVRLRENGVHAVDAVQIQSSDDCLALHAPPEEAGAGTEPADAEALAATPVVDMLVAYTPAGEKKAGGRSSMIALIQSGVADTNRAFSYSGANLRARLVGTYRLLQNETGAWSSDLAALRLKTDGRWDAIHAERKRLGADQVTLVGAFTYGGSTNGIGYINAGHPHAFSLVKVSSFGAYSFSHELGHNIGLNHSDGYVNSGGRFRTVMAYGSYPRVRRFSNPSRAYNGWRTGTSSRNSTAILNANAARIAKLAVTVVKGESVGDPGPEDPSQPSPAICPE